MEKFLNIGLVCAFGGDEAISLFCSKGKESATTLCGFAKSKNKALTIIGFANGKNDANVMIGCAKAKKTAFSIFGVAVAEDYAFSVFGPAFAKKKATCVVLPLAFAQQTNWAGWSLLKQAFCCIWKKLCFSIQSRVCKT